MILFFSAFALSLVFAAQPGVVGMETLRRGLAHGWRPALYLQFGTLIGDATWALIALFGAAVLFQNRAISIALSLFGCFLLLKFAWGAFTAARAEIVLDLRETGGQVNGRGHFATGAALSLSNPGNITFWLGMSGTIISLGFLNPQPADIAVFFIGFMSAQVVWSFFMAGVVHLGRRVITPRAFRAVNLVCALALAYFGLSLLISTVQLALSA